MQWGPLLTENTNTRAQHSRMMLIIAMESERLHPTNCHNDNDPWIRECFYTSLNQEAVVEDRLQRSIESTTFKHRLHKVDISSEATKYLCDILLGQLFAFRPFLPPLIIVLRLCSDRMKEVKNRKIEKLTWGKRPGRLLCAVGQKNSVGFTNLSLRDSDRRGKRDVEYLQL